VASAVSFSNTCPYCVEVHGATLIGLRGDADARAIVSDKIDTVADPELRSLAQWARNSGLRTRDRRLPAPFPPDQIPELVGIACTFHYINRMVNVFLAESPLPSAPGPALGLVRRRAAGIMRGLAGTSLEPGLSLPLLPEAPLPPDLSWAAGQPALAAAWARAARAIDAGGVRSVPAEVRALVRSRLADPRSGVPGISSRIWLDETVAGLPEPHRPAGRLALLMAFASYQVTPHYIEEYKAQGHDDQALIELTSWACFATARQIGTELVRDLRLTATETS
jgi:alkylhydroperoxidase family enzyme